MFNYLKLSLELKKKYTKKIQETTFKFKEKEKVRVYKKSNYTKAAVMCILVPSDKEKSLSIILTLRSKSLKDHSGQISFPGGKFKDTDKNSIHCALRETEEEIGLNSNKINILGKMCQYATGSGFVIQPIVGYIEKKTNLIIDANEVEQAIYFPIKHLFKDSNVVTSFYTDKYNNKLSYYDFKWNNFRIWGTTAMILYDISKIVRYTLLKNV